MDIKSNCDKITLTARSDGNNRCHCRPPGNPNTINELCVTELCQHSLLLLSAHLSQIPSCHWMFSGRAFFLQAVQRWACMFTQSQHCRQRAETIPDNKETMDVCNPVSAQYVNAYSAATSYKWHMCCIFVCRTGQFVCGRWTAGACDAWPEAPATPMQWAQSPVPGNLKETTSQKQHPNKQRDKHLHLCVCSGWKHLL